MFQHKVKFSFTCVNILCTCISVTGYLAEHHQPDPTSSPEEPPAKRARNDVSVVESFGIPPMKVPI